MRPTPPTATDDDLKAKILIEISAHIRVHGRERWELVRERPEFAAVIGKEAGPSGKRKFFRWVESVSKATPPDKTRPHEAREVADNAMEDAITRARAASVKNIPAPISPAYMLRAGASAERKIDFLAELCVMFDDAFLLRQSAVNAETGALEDAKVWAESIKVRAKLINQGVAIYREIYDHKEQVKFYEIIVDIMVNLLADVPDKQEEVIRRFEQHNASRGLVVVASSPT